MMKFEEMRGARMQAYANALGIRVNNGEGGMPAFSTAGSLRETMDQMGDQEYMISVEIGGKDESGGDPHGKGAAALQLRTAQIPGGCRKSHR